MSPLAFHLPGDPDLVHAATLYPADGQAGVGALLVLAHGAGAGQASPFMARYAAGLAARGLDVVTFNFPYMEARRKAPDRAPVLEDTFRRAVVGATTHRMTRGRAVFIGGKSMGGRMATHLAAAPDAWPAEAPPLRGAIAFGYPLHPPGNRRQDRAAHLARLSVPLLVVQGTRDSFGGPDTIAEALPDAARARVTIHTVEGGDHSYKVPKTSGRTEAEVDGEVWDAVVSWITRIAGSRSR
ncbi:MAG: alpha/beta family hydrolase [Vicinamibacterales bacterium]